MERTGGQGGVRKQLLDNNLKGKRKINGTGKKKLQIAFIGELALEEAMDLRKTGNVMNKILRD
jgi:hypothetical protein